MKGYFAIFKARMLTLLQYRAAALAGLMTQLFWGLVYAMILTAFYQASPENSPISLETAINFVWINQAFWLLVPWNVDKAVEAEIKTGQVAYELIRPLDLYWLWFTRSLAMRTIMPLMRAIPIFVVAGLFLGLQAPVSIEAAIAFVASIFLSILLSSAMTTIAVITLFWTLSGEGILRLLPHVAIFFSGLVVPLPLFPDWMQTFLSLQPFRCIADIPCRLYTGMIPAEQAPLYMALQLAWTLIFIIWGRDLIRRAMKKVVIQGG